MTDRRDQDNPDAPEQGLDADVVVSSDAGTVSGLGPHEALDELEAEQGDEPSSGDAT